MSYYSNFRNEVINTATNLYNLIPEEIRELVEEGMVVFSDFNNTVKIIQVYNKFKERTLIKKIDLFLRNVDNLSLQEINELLEKCQKSKEKFTEQLIIMIDRLESEEKVNYFSKLFILFATTNMNKQLYFRCCKILENYSYYDLIDFKSKRMYSLDNEDDVIKFSIGLLQNPSPRIGRGWERNSLGFGLIISEAGKIFIKLNKELEENK